MKIATIALRNALKLISPVITKNIAIPILEGVKISDNHLTASNNEVSVRVPLNMAEPLPDCVLDFATLAASVNRLTDDQIEFSLTDTAAIIKAGRTRITVPKVGKPGDYPEMVADESAPACTLTRQDVERVAAMAAFINPNNAHPALQGIYFDGSDFCATNSHVLANYKIKGETGEGSVLPVRLFALLHAFTGAPEFVFERGAVTVKQGDEVRAEIKFRCIDENFPAWRDVVPDVAKFGCSLFEREEMADAIEVLKIGADKTTNSAAFEFGKNDGILAKSSDVGLNKDAATSITASNDRFKENVRIGFNTAFLSTVLKFIGGDEIQGYVMDERKAAIFKNPDFNGFALIMPVMIAEN